MHNKLLQCAVAALLAVALLVLVGGRLYAGLLSCAHCGHSGNCCKVCRLVKEEKKVDITCWGVKCEPWCIPCHSKRGCKHHEVVCDDCDEDDDEISTKPKKFVWYEWIPGCAKIHHKKKLMKKTVSKKISSYKWVVEDLCKKCEAELPVAEVEPGVVIPPKPVLMTR